MTQVTDGSYVEGNYVWDVNTNNNLYMYPTGNVNIDLLMDEWVWNTDEVVLFIHYNTKKTISFGNKFVKPDSDKMGFSITISPRVSNENRMDILIFQRFNSLLYLKNHLKDCCCSW